jgi:ketosteroid isomerase-like protein
MRARSEVLSRVAGKRDAQRRAAANVLWPALLALLWGSCAGSAHAKMYSCRNAAGTVVLRDAPCKPGESDQEGGSQARPYPSSSAPSKSHGTKPITEVQVQGMLDGMDAARRRGDVAAMLAYLVPDVVIEAEYRLPQGMRFKRLNKNEYAAYLRSAAADAQDFRRERTQIVLTPSADQAEIASTLRETVRIDGAALKGVTRSKALVEMRDGQLQVTMLRVVTSLEPPAGENPK